MKTVSIALASLMLMVGCRTTSNGDTATVKSNAAPLLATDGCYALGDPGVLAGVICIAGSALEGIGGADTTVAYGGSLLDASWCGKTTSIKNTLSSATYNFRPESGIISIEFKGDSKEGKVVISETGSAPETLSYFRTEQSGNDMFQSRKCAEAR